ncbi:MAG TPA: recombinase family protein [Pseudobdellovibrionaceae bacterium]
METSTSQPKKRRTALYARVSTGNQATGLDAQIRVLRIFCEQNNIADCELLADENQSGTKASRPALDRMMKAVEEGEIENVIVFAFSRYARSVSHMLRGLEIMRKNKTNFISLSEKLDLNTSLGNVVFVIISAISQLERDLIAERVRNGLAAARARGAKIGRVRKRNDALIHSLLKAGLSFREIARIAKCSHGSVSASKKEYLVLKALEDKQKQEESTTKFDDNQGLCMPVALLEASPDTDAKIAAAKNVGEQEKS